MRLPHRAGDRADPDDRKIRLVVATRKSTSPNPKPDPVVYLAGGPGGTPLVHGFDNWQLDRDLILLGERGTMKDDPFLSCPEVDQFLADAVGIGAEDPTYSEKSAAALRTCRDRLTKQGINLAAYNTTENAADVADLRIAMGIDHGTSMRSPTAPISRCRRCVTIRRVSGRWRSTRCCHRRPT